MLNISLGRTDRCLTAPHTRRTFLQVGSLTAFGMSLPRLLAAEHTSPASKARAKSVILVFLGGGISHHDTFDMKPEASEQIRGKYKPIASSVPGTMVGELLPQIAKQMHKLALIRSCSHDNESHQVATNWMMSGRFGSPFGEHPAIGAVAAHEFGFQTYLPPYVAIPKNPFFTWELGKSAYLGGRYESFKVGDPNDANFRVPDVAPREALTDERLKRRQSLLAAVDSLSRRVEGNDQLDTFDEFYKRATNMVLSPEAKAAFDIGQEKNELRDRFGRTTFGQSCLLARRLIERGVRFATVNFGGWDDHKDIWKGLDKRLPIFDQGFSALIEDLDTRGQLAETLVVAMGEFGRTPKINDSPGRDHWPPAASLLLAGAGVRGGKIIGQTDKDGAFVMEDQVTPADVSFTILDSLGINPRKTLNTADGRPVEVLDLGHSITQLYG
jgi:hypothetical protein